MAKSKWDGAEEPTINNIFKIEARIFLIMLLKSADWPRPTAVFHVNRSRQKYSLATSVLGDSNGPPAGTQSKWKNKLERD